MKLEYLLFNLTVAIGPLLANFLYRKRVQIAKLPFLLSVAVGAVIFIAWDILVTGYFWYFNSCCILGYSLGSIPIEEALFFITVPSACLFLYINLAERLDNKQSIKRIFIQILIAILFLFGLIFLLFGKYYSFVILFLLGIIWFGDMYIMKTNLVLRVGYWQFMGVVLLLTFIFNYYLTSRPIVLYNDLYNLNFKILTIPIEDFFYSVELISLVVIFYKYFDVRLTKLRK